MSMVRSRLANVADVSDSQTRASSVVIFDQPLKKKLNELLAGLKQSSTDGSAPLRLSDLSAGRSSSP